MLPVIAPELLPLEATPQDPGWHPEGDVWTHTLQVVDEAAALGADLGDDRPRQLAVMLGGSLPRPRQAVDDALRGRPHPLPRARGGRAAADRAPCSTAGTCTRSSATTCGRRSSAWWPTT